MPSVAPGHALVDEGRMRGLQNGRTGALTAGAGWAFCAAVIVVPAAAGVLHHLRVAELQSMGLCGSALGGSGHGLHRPP